MVAGIRARYGGRSIRLWLPLALPGILSLPLAALAVGLAVLCAGIAVAAVLLFALQMSSVPVETHGDEARPSFHSAFGFEPGADVRDVHSLVYVFMDSAQQRLRFEASPETVDRILALGLEPVDCADFDRETKSPIAGKPAPSWWSPPTEARVCYRASEWRRGLSFSSTGAFLCRSAGHPAVFFYSFGVD